MSCRRPKRRSGYALLLVVIIILTSTAMSAVYQRHLNSALRIEQARVASEENARGPLSVLAVALESLDSGDPPAPVDYSYSHTVDSTTTLYRVMYRNVLGQWIVTAEPDPTAGSLPTLPTNF